MLFKLIYYEDGVGGTLGVKMVLTSAQPGLRSLAPPFCGVV